MKSFEEAWVYSNSLKGWYTEAEARLLWHCCLGKRIACEIGAYRGRSASLLAEAVDILHIIEPFILAPGSPNDTPESQGRYVSSAPRRVIFRDFFTNLGRFHDRIRLHAGTTEQVEIDIGLGPIDLLHVDGDHVDGIFIDIELMAPHILPGGIAVFHDYLPIHTKFTRVKEAVDALGWPIIGQADSAVAVQKPW